MPRLLARRALSRRVRDFYAYAGKIAHVTGGTVPRIAARPRPLVSIAAVDVRCVPRKTPKAGSAYDDEAVWTSRTGSATSSARRGERTHSTAATSATNTQPAPIRNASW